MRAVITLTMYAEVRDNDHAAELASVAEEDGRLNMASVLEEHGFTATQVRDEIGFLGVSYWLLPEDEKK